MRKQVVSASDRRALRSQRNLPTRETERNAAIVRGDDGYATRRIIGSPVDCITKQEYELARQNSDPNECIRVCQFMLGSRQSLNLT